jgi:D-arabinose 1-dehydrogenase-like Zn-dependent alcohol dehydrogenase
MTATTVTAMVLRRSPDGRRLAELPRPEPGPGQLLVKARACGVCRYCRASRENLCEAARFTGQTLDGGYGEDLLADQRYCFPLSGGGSDAEAAVRLVDSG